MASNVNAMNESMQEEFAALLFTYYSSPQVLDIHHPRRNV